MTIDVSVTRIPTDDLQALMSEIRETSQIGTQLAGNWDDIRDVLLSGDHRALLQAHPYIAVDVELSGAGIDMMSSALGSILSMDTVTGINERRAREHAASFRLGLRQVASGVLSIGRQLDIHAEAVLEETTPPRPETIADKITLIQDLAEELDKQLHDPS